MVRSGADCTFPVKEPWGKDDEDDKDEQWSTRMFVLLVDCGWSNTDKEVAEGLRRDIFLCCYSHERGFV
jgi:hypothetical protein